MRRIGGGRKVAAGEFVFALRSGLDPTQTVGDGVVDHLIVAQFEVQEWMMLERTPMAAIKGVRADKVDRPRNIAASPPGP